MKKIGGLVLLVFLLISTSYANSLQIKSTYTKSDTSNLTQKEWTIMAYLDGDNNIQNDILRSFNYLDYEGYNENINVVAQLDVKDSSLGVRRFIVAEDDNITEVQKLDELSMGDEETLVDFVTWAKNNYPAKKYCLVLSDHGCGWRKGFLIDETNTIIDEGEEKSDFLSMTELKSSMNRIKDVLDGNKLDLLFLNACMMGMVEIYYQIRDTTKVCLASPCGDKLCPFHMVFDDLYEDVTCNETVLAEYFYYASYYFASGIDHTIVDLVMVNSDLVDALDSFADELIDNFKKCKDEIKQAITNSKSYNGPGGYIMHYRDLFDFANEISDITTCESLKTKAEELKNIILKCKILPSGMWGVSIYLPVFDREYKYDPSYTDLDLCKDTNWDDFVLKTKNLRSASLDRLVRNHPCFSDIIRLILQK